MILWLSHTQVLPKDGEEFGMIVDYVRNTHGATHTSYDLEVLEAFELSRHGEEKRYKPFRKLHNRMLLWHGSRTTNYVGIISQVCIAEVATSILFLMKIQM